MQLDAAFAAERVGGRNYKRTKASYFTTANKSRKLDLHMLRDSRFVPQALPVSVVWQLDVVSRTGKLKEAETVHRTRELICNSGTQFIQETIHQRF